MTVSEQLDIIWALPVGPVLIALALAGLSLAAGVIAHIQETRSRRSRHDQP